MFRTFLPLLRVCPSFIVGVLRFGYHLLVKLPKGDFYHLFRVLTPSLLEGPQADPFFFFFACSMTRGQEETSTSQAGRKRGTPPEITHYKQPGCCYVYRRVEILLSSPS